MATPAVYPRLFEIPSEKNVAQLRRSMKRQSPIRLRGISWGSGVPKPGPVVCAEAWSSSEARPPVACRSPAGRVRRSLAACRVPKPGRPPVTAQRGPARPAALRGGVRSGPPSQDRPGSAGGGRETGKPYSMTVEITCACRRMTGRVVLPTFGNKSRKTTNSEPSTGHQFWESRETAKFDAPVGLLGLVPRTGCNYDSLDETNWPCASSCQLLETNRGKRQSPSLLRGISWGSVNVCLHSFQHNSVPTGGLTAGVIMNH